MVAMRWAGPAGEPLGREAGAASRLEVAMYWGGPAGKLPGAVRREVLAR